MAKPRKLENITIDGHEDHVTIRKAPASTIAKSKAETEEDIIKAHGSHGAGINSKSPVIYVSPEMKRVLKLLKAQILIMDGVSISESAIVARALKEYCNNNQTDFYNNNITLFDSL